MGMDAPVLIAGANGGYRLYTVEHLPFDALPEYMDGGPPLVVIDPWAVSTSFPTDDSDGPQYTLHARTVDMEPHPLNGSRYATRRDADRAVYDAGLLAFMVYEREAADFPITAIA